jgi:hypothetical protein
VSTKKSTLERLPTVVIENMEPCIDGGRYPVKRIVGQELKVSADVSKDGPSVMSLKNVTITEFLLLYMNGASDFTAAGNRRGTC